VAADRGARQAAAGPLADRDSTQRSVAQLACHIDEDGVGTNHRQGQTGPVLSGDFDQ